MTKQIVLELKQVTKRITNFGDEEQVIMDAVDLTVQKGDFITVLGGNGAGKSTLFNLISGNLQPSSGKIMINAQEVTHYSEEKRAKYLARVFQDPKMGTAPRMTVGENLLLARLRGEKRGLARRNLNHYRDDFMHLLSLPENGLDQHFSTPTGSLSGGQRQALSLLMATLKDPDVLLLDEHTAALDPKTSRNLMKLTQKIVGSRELTCLMITHQLQDALDYGNRLLVLKNGKISSDFNSEQKAKLTMDELLEFFR